MLLLSPGINQNVLGPRFFVLPEMHRLEEISRKFFLTFQFRDFIFR